MWLIMAVDKKQGQILSWQVRRNEPRCNSDLLLADLPLTWQIIPQCNGKCTAMYLAETETLDLLKGRDAEFELAKAVEFRARETLHHLVCKRKSKALPNPSNQSFPLLLLSWLLFTHSTALGVQKSTQYFPWQREYPALRTAHNENK